jgi:hypothetical protein
MGMRRGGGGGRQVAGGTAGGWGDGRWLGAGMGLEVVEHVGGGGEGGV